jgi:hypothetical protein
MSIIDTPKTPEVKLSPVTLPTIALVWGPVSAPEPVA